MVRKILSVVIPRFPDGTPRRGRDYEQIVERKYWENLNKNYTEYFANYNLSDVLVINVDELDIKDNPEHKEWFIKTVREKLKQISAKW